MQRKKLDSFHYTKISFKWIKDLNIKAETIKLLEENNEKSFLTNSLGSDFLDMTPKAQMTREKNRQWNDIKLKNFYTANETINKVKR